MQMNVPPTPIVPPVIGPVQKTDSNGNTSIWSLVPEKNSQGEVYVTGDGLSYRELGPLAVAENIRFALPQSVESISASALILSGDVIRGAGPDAHVGYTAIRRSTSPGARSGDYEVLANGVLSLADLAFLNESLANANPDDGDAYIPFGFYEEPQLDSNPPEQFLRRAIIIPIDAIGDEVELHLEVKPLVLEWYGTDGNVTRQPLEGFVGAISTTRFPPGSIPVVIDTDPRG